MTFRYIVYASGIRLLFKMGEARSGEVIWSSYTNDPRLGLAYDTVPEINSEDGDFEDEADSLEQFLEKHIERFL